MPISLLLVLGLAMSQAAAPPAAPENPPQAWHLQLDDPQSPAVSMAVGNRSSGMLMIYCSTQDGTGIVSVTFPEVIGGSLGTEVRYSFDKGPEMRGTWIGGGSTHAMGARRIGIFDPFVRGLTASHSVRISARRQHGRERQEVTLAYADPGPMLDEMNRRCQLNL